MKNWKVKLLWYEILPEYCFHLQIRWEIFVDQVQCLPYFAVHRTQQLCAQLIEQPRKQYEQPVIQIVRMQNDEFVDGVQKQCIHLGVAVHEHFAE